MTTVPTDSVIDQKITEEYALYHGDCVRVVRGIPSDSIHFCISSWPFVSLYQYTDATEDMSNIRTKNDFFNGIDFMLSELARVMMPGRLVGTHCMELPTSMEHDGVIGLYDFPGDIIRAFQKHGFVFHSRVTIWKDPLIAATRTHALGLAHKQIVKDSTMCRQGIPDQLVVMRKLGKNPEPVTHPRGLTKWIGNPEDEPKADRHADQKKNKYSHYVWQNYASPVWMDINPSDTLQRAGARDAEDSKHICLASGSLVLTRDQGYIPIEDVEIGDRVLTHKGRWKPVVAKLCNGRTDTIRVCAQGVADLRVTPEHELWTKQAPSRDAKRIARASDPRWVEAQSTIGSYINQKLPPEEVSPLTAEEWWIVGRWLGDGHCGGRESVRARGGLGQFLISCAHEEAVELKQRLGRYAGHAAEVTATQIAIVGLRKEVRDVLSRCGRGARYKKLPGEAVALCAEKAESLLDGYLSADGHYVGKHDRYMASSVSRALLLGMSMVAQRCRNVVASVYAGRPERSGVIEGRQVSMSQDWIFAFRNSDGYRKSGWIQGDGAWKKVRKIETSGVDTVWDIQVDDDSSFTAEGAIVHNCPLQLTVIRRAVELWSNPRDVVFDPFTGIGSSGYVALQEQRRFIGSELKESYFRNAGDNLDAAIESRSQGSLQLSEVAIAEVE